ncbi:hypothetical protein B0A66_21270, partial [Flavobacterium hercynium]
TVTDANGCTISTSTPIVVTTPVNPVITSISAVDVLCNGTSTGSIVVTHDLNQGTAPFVYTVLNTTTGVNYGQQTSGLPAGTYSVTLTDAKGCTDVRTITIAEPTAIVVNRTIHPITCIPGGGQSKGQIIIDSVTGGTPNYIYHVTGVNGYNRQFTNQTGATQVFDVVDFGLYQIIVTDANGCANIEQNILVASPPDDLDITILAPPANCLAGGSAELSVGSKSGIIGPGPFHFAVYSGPTMPPYSSPTTLPWYDEDAPGSKKVTLTNLTPGVLYTFVVYDENTGCKVEKTADQPIPTHSGLTTSGFVAKNITCTGSADGNVTFDIVSPYSTATPVDYEIFNSQSHVSTGVMGTGIVPANGTLTVSNLGPLPFGNYYVLVKEAAGSVNGGCSVAT